MDVMLFSKSYYYPKLLEGADSVGGQLHGDKECPFRDVTSSGSVWRKVPECDPRSVGFTHTVKLMEGRPVAVHGFGVWRGMPRITCQSNA